MRPRFVFGVLVSITWLGACAVLLFAKRGELVAMPPNAWGDFFAGAFAPLAFLWLVLGYLQQGEELQLSTRALLLQAEELKHSVEQQRALVEVSRQQVQSEREALEFERKHREEAAKPKFLVAHEGGSFHGGGAANYSLVLSNAGNMASSVIAELTLPDGKTLQLLDLPVLDRGAQHRARVGLSAPFGASTGSLQVRYKDSLGVPGVSMFSVRAATEHPHSALEFAPVEA